MYTVYQRLVELKPHPTDVDQAVPRDTNDRSKASDDVLCSILGDGHNNCQCYADFMKTMQAMKKKDGPLFVTDGMTKHIWKNYERNQDVQFPLSTILVEWLLQRRFRPYTKHELRNILSCYGTISAIYKHSNNSALIVFDDLSSACRAIESKQLGYNMTCSWWNKYMLTHCTYTTSENAHRQSDRVYFSTAKLNHSTAIIY